MPNTLARGLNAGKDFAVAAIDVAGSIDLASPGGISESDYYAFDGRAGDLINIEIFSWGLVGRGVDPVLNPIDSILRLYDASGNLVSYYDTPAINDDGFEGTRDAILLDVRLPDDGSYYIEVDTFAAEFDADTGAYELFFYRFSTGNAADAGDLLQGLDGDDILVGYLGADTLVGGAGSDLLDGGLGDDTYLVVLGGADSIVDAGGLDRLDLSGSAPGAMLDLGLRAGQAQVVNAAGAVLRLTGTLEVVVGTAGADRIDASALDVPVTLRGGLGDDTLLGGSAGDLLDGGDGRDFLLGGDGPDTLLGGLGHDVLVGGAGVDLLDGGDGYDVLIGSAPTGSTAAGATTC